MAAKIEASAADKKAAKLAKKLKRKESPKKLLDGPGAWIFGAILAAWIAWAIISVSNTPKVEVVSPVATHEDSSSGGDHHSGMESVHDLPMSTYSDHSLSPLSINVPLTSETSPRRPFTRLLYPVSMEQFFTENFEKKLLHIRKGPQWLSQFGIDLGGLDLLLMAQKAAARDPRLMHPELNETQAGCEVVKHGFTDRSAETPDIYTAYLNGYNVVCHIAGAYHRQLGSTLLEMSNEVGWEMSGNIYLNPRGSQGFGIHNDNKDGFIVQLDGEKHWVATKSKFPLPMRNQMVGRPWQEPAAGYKSTTVFNHTLVKGDLLYVPRGYLHYAVSLPSSPSLHVTISPVMNYEFVDFLSDYTGMWVTSGILADYVIKFLRNTFVVAVKAEGNTRPGRWIRRAVPRCPNEIDSEKCIELVTREFLEVMGQLKVTMEATLGEQLTSQPAGLKAFRDTFAALMYAEERSEMIQKTLDSRGHIKKYVRDFLENPAVAEEKGITDETALKVIGKVDISSAGDDGSFQVSHGGNKAVFRKQEETSRMLRSLALLSIGSSTNVASFGGSDPFERVCLVRVLASIGAVAFIA